MSIWWVNLGTGYKAQIGESALWAPNHGKNPVTGSLYSPRWHWKILGDVSPGEFLVLCEDQRIMGIAIAAEAPLPNAQPPKDLRLHPTWNDEGWLLKVKLALLQTPLDRNNIANGLFLTKTFNSPVRRDKLGKLQGNQIYAAKVPELDSAVFLDRIIYELNQQKPGAFNALIDAALEVSSSGDQKEAETTKEALIKARVGQGQFRTELLHRWNKQCCATGLQLTTLLRASHILSWSESDNKQRLDEFNGLLLSPAYDAAFDAYLITLRDDGSWQWDPKISEDELHRAGLGKIEQQNVKGLTDQHAFYLEKHRQKALKRWEKQ